MYLWLLVIIVLSMIEVSTTSLVCIWYIVSAFLALVVSLFVFEFYIQFGVFVLVGTILLLLTRKILANRLVQKEKTNLDRIFDMKGVVTEDIDELVIGEVLVDGKKWSAIASEPIKKGARVKIIKIDGVKLIVERIKE